MAFKAALLCSHCCYGLKLPQAVLMRSKLCICWAKLCVWERLVNKPYFPDFRTRLYTIYAGTPHGPRPPPSAVAARARHMHHARDDVGDDIGVCAFHLDLRIPFKINDLRASCKLIQNRISEIEILVKHTAFRLISHKIDWRYTKKTNQSTTSHHHLTRL
jgi:hypothetical protein